MRIGIVGAGANTRLRHIPGFRAVAGIELAGVVNRSDESTRRVAEEFGIPQRYQHWQQLIDDERIDAVLIGTWPYLHAAITIAALRAGKHVLTEARMAMNAAEARAMYQASLERPDLVAMIVPSPLGFFADRVVRRLLGDGFLGELREFVVLGTDNSRMNPESPSHWRQIQSLSGVNALQLGILHETLIRWIPDPVRVMAQSQVFVKQRRDPATGQHVSVDTPDNVHVLTELPIGVHGLYHLSSVAHLGPGHHIHLYGSEGTLKYQLAPADRLWGGKKNDRELQEIPVPAEDAYGWRVEAEFVGATRGEEPVQYTTFDTGVRYMEFTEAVAMSASSGQPVELPLKDEPII